MTTIDHLAALRGAIDSALSACAEMREGDRESEERAMSAQSILAMVAITSGREVIDEVDKLRAALANIRTLSAYPLITISGNHGYSQLMKGKS